MPETTQLDTRTTPAGVTGPVSLGELLAQYDVLSEIGRGGMGVVFKARHRQLDRPVAVKVCLPDGPLDRFAREARLLARVRSPHVVPVYDYAPLTDGRAALVMAWVDGQDLDRARKQAAGPLAEPSVLPWMTDVCEGMLAAEAEGIVHRDLKPSNVLVDSGGRALVADFGLAREPASDALSHTGQVLGTPYYMAPEQAEDPRRADTRSDVYSFGATFYHLLTGRPPFDGPSHFSVLLKHKTEPLEAPQRLNAWLSDRTAQVLERCLAKNPADRFGSFAEVRAALRPDAVAPWELSDDLRLVPYMTRFAARRTAYLTRGAIGGPNDEYRFAGDRVLSVTVGDITSQTVQAVVSSDDCYLTMGGGVSYAILKAGGKEIRADGQRFTPVRAGRVVVTRAGRLPARFVFHGITIGWADAGLTGPTRDLILEVLDGCFYHADTLGVQSLAVPLLGTGAGGFAPEVCLDTIFRYLARKLLHGLTVVRDVRIVIYRNAGREPSEWAVAL